MSKDDKPITGSQESIQARLAALNAMMHKTKEPEPVQEEPAKPTSEEAASSEGTAEAVTEAAPEQEADVSVTSADTGAETAETAAEEGTASETSEAVAEEATAAESTEAAPENPSEESFSAEGASEPAEDGAFEGAEEVPDTEVSNVPEEAAVAEAEAAPETAEGAQTAETSETEEAAAETTTENAEEAAAEPEAETNAQAEEAAETAAEEAPAADASLPDQPAEDGASEQPAAEETAPAEPAMEEPAAEAASEPAPTPLRSAPMNAASLKERMGALVAATRGVVQNNTNGNSDSGASAIIASAGDDVNSLMKAGFEALEESEFDKAKDIFDSCVAKDKARGAAYFGQLLAYFNVKNTSEFYDLVMIRTRKNLPKKKVTPPLFNDFEAYIKSGLKCSAELNPKEIKILFGHLKAPYKSIVGGIETTLEENKDLVEIYCDYMGNPASLYYKSFKEFASGTELTTYDINPALFEGLKKLKDEEIEADRRRNSGEELTSFLNQVDETYDSLADTGLDPALRTAAALKKLNHLGAVPFGHKPGKDAPVAWIPVSKDGDNILLMTRECIEFMLFGQNNKWTDSEIRRWLNGTFYVDYFNDQERSLIHKESQETAGNAKFGTDGCKTTRDNIFIFSIAEANKFFSEEGERASDEWYWLRSPGGGSNYVAAVEPSGRIDEYGSLMSLDSGGVRPAVWINFSGSAE